MSKMSFAVLALGVLGGSARADLHFPQPFVKLGEVYSGRPLRQRFAFTNRGPEAVTIQRLEAICGCMTPRLDKTTYQPGESGSFVLEVNTLTQPVGPNTWRVRVHHDGKVQELFVSAVLRAEIKVEPPMLALSAEGALAHDVVVSDQRALPFRVTAAHASSPHMTTSILAGQDGRSFRVHLEVKADMPPGTHQEIVSILTDDPAYRELRVPVTIHKRAKAGVTPAPATVSLTIPRGQPAPTRSVLLRGEAEGNVVVEKIEVDNPALRCIWVAGPGKMATLRVSADSLKVTDVLRGTIRVHISKPAAGVVAIPVTCTVR